MGLFSKKVMVCERCGKEYETRITIGEHVCSACLDREYKRRETVKGYIKYAEDVRRETYTEDEMVQIAEHRAAILERSRVQEGISRAELTVICDNCRSLSDDQAKAVLRRVRKTVLMTAAGAAYCDRFLVPTGFENTIVDVEDVFAVGYVSDWKLSTGKMDTLMCVVFTNDPYMPVFHLLMSEDLRFLELRKSKALRKTAEELFEKLCPNLTYPVQELKQLSKQIKAEGCVKGSLDQKFMQEMISAAMGCRGIFDAKKVESLPSEETLELLESYGYLPALDILDIMKLDRMFGGRFWNKYLKDEPIF